jgi:hypothetical protein
MTSVNPMRPTTPNTIPESTLFCKKPVGCVVSVTGLVEIEGAALDPVGPTVLKTVSVDGGPVAIEVGGGVELVLGAGDGAGLEGDAGALDEGPDADTDAEAEAEVVIEELAEAETEALEEEAVVDSDAVDFEWWIPKGSSGSKGTPGSAMPCLAWTKMRR